MMKQKVISKIFFISLFLFYNDELMQNAAMSNTVEYMDHMGEHLAKDVEEWLGKRDDSEE